MSDQRQGVWVDREEVPPDCVEGCAGGPRVGPPFGSVFGDCLSAGGAPPRRVPPRRLVAPETVHESTRLKTVANFFDLACRATISTEPAAALQTIGRHLALTSSAPTPTQMETLAVLVSKRTLCERSAGWFVVVLPEGGFLMKKKAAEVADYISWHPGCFVDVMTTDGPLAFVQAQMMITV
jgi:hypothetical protein